MNVWGLVVIALGLIIAVVGLRGTQAQLYQDVFGKPYTPAANPILPRQ